MKRLEEKMMKEIPGRDEEIKAKVQEIQGLEEKLKHTRAESEKATKESLAKMKALEEKMTKDMAAKDAEIKAKVLDKRKAEAERRDRLGDQSPDEG